MGLKLTLEKDMNHMYYDFVDAYWKLEDISYTTEHVSFALCAYPSREASKNKNGKVEYGLPFGGSAYQFYMPLLYKWNGAETISTVFPEGIPLGANEQLTGIYNWVKRYTGIPFEDVLEE